MKLTNYKKISIVCGIIMIIVLINKFIGMIVLSVLGAGLWLTDNK